MSNSITMKYKYHLRYLIKVLHLPGIYIFFFVNLVVINISTKCLLVIDRKKEQEHLRLLTSFCPDWRKFIPLAYFQIPDAQLWMSATSAPTTYVTVIWHLNSVDLKNTELSSARSAPSNTCQRQSTALSAAAGDSPVILSVTAPSRGWKHRQCTQLLAVAAALMGGVESEGQQQLF